MAEPEKLFDRETVLDLTVNFIPLAILLVFVVLYLVFSPFGFNSVLTTIQFGIIGVMFVALAILTYYSGAAVSRAEKAREREAAGGELAEASEAGELGGEADPAVEEAPEGELESGASEAGELGDEAGDGPREA